MLCSTKSMAFRYLHSTTLEIKCDLGIRVEAMGYATFVEATIHLKRKKILRWMNDRLQHYRDSSAKLFA